MRNKRERWIGVSGLLLGVALAFALVEAAALARVPIRFEAASLVTGACTLSAFLILATKLRK